MLPLSESQNDLPLGGRLKSYCHLWQDPHTVNLLEKGLTWEWDETALFPSNSMLNPRASKTDLQLLPEIEEMIKLRVIAPIDPEEILFLGFVFGKLKPSGKKRTIFDMSALNPCILNEHFTMLKNIDLLHLITPHCLMISLDLSNAYWHVPIHPHFQRYLTFPFNGQFWKFLAMPFGLNIAPRTFTRIMKDLVRYWTELKIQVVSR